MRFHYLLSSREIAISKKVFEEDLEFFSSSLFADIDMIHFPFLFLTIHQKIENVLIIRLMY